MIDREADRRAAEALEREGDEAARGGGEAVNLYRKAQKVLLPTGIQWSDAEEYDWRQAAFDRIQRKIWDLGTRPAATAPAAPSEACRKFLDSMNIGYEQWHDGIGYDLEALGQVSEAERRYIADMLLQRARSHEADWRDIEALEALDLPEARPVLEQALRTARPEIRLRIARTLSAQGVPVEIDRIIADILRRGRYEDGLSAALDLAAGHATPYLREVLLECARDGHPDVRVHAAALTLYLAGQAESPFDLNQRPFLLQFGKEDRATRERAFAELCRRIAGPRSALPK